MPGWIIQGVRGEGKSLAAVGKIKEYLLKGRPVATNLNLYLENFLPPENTSMVYRLPDHPRLEDFQLLPPAYNPKYKPEDRNGLLVLDELGTWMNSRNWNDKSRLKLLNWLFLSRKDHWDLILLAQDVEMIDAQVRTTLCDYLVQASRLDRQKIPYLAPLLEFFGINAFMPKIHRYFVFYGLSMANKPVETWTFTGKHFYDGYDTNQKFLDGQEPLNGTLVDMRATYSYLPANYLTRHVFIERLRLRITQLQQLKPIENDGTMAAKKNMGNSPKPKIILLSVFLVGFLGWRFMGGVSLPGSSSKLSPDSSAHVANAKPNVSGSQASLPLVTSPSPVQVPLSSKKAVFTASFVDVLLTNYRPRISISAYSPDIGIVGFVDFYQGQTLVEQYSIKELHSLGVSFIKRPYGADLIYDGKSYILTSWLLPSEPVQFEPEQANETKI